MLHFASGGTMFINAAGNLVTLGIATVVFVITTAVSYSYRAQISDFLVYLCLRLRFCDPSLTQEYMARRQAIRWINYICEQLIRLERRVHTRVNEAGLRSNEIIALTERIEDDLKLYSKKCRDSQEEQKKLWRALVTHQAVCLSHALSANTLDASIDYGVMVVERYKRRLHSIQNPDH